MHTPEPDPYRDGFARYDYREVVDIGTRIREAMAQLEEDHRARRQLDAVIRATRWDPLPPPCRFLGMRPPLIDRHMRRRLQHGRHYGRQTTESAA